MRKRPQYPAPGLELGVVYRHIGASRIPDDSRRAVPFAIAAFLVRGIYLWAVIPMTAALWIVLTPVRLLRRRTDRPSLVQWLAWGDELVLVAFERSILFPFGVRAAWPRPPAHRAPARAPSPFELW